jgi:hypothetical protein
MGWMLDFEGTRFFSIFIPLSFSFSFSVFVYPSHTSLVKENAGWPGCVSFFGPCTNVFHGVCILNVFCSALFKNIHGTLPGNEVGCLGVLHS